MIFIHLKFTSPFTPLFWDIRKHLANVRFSPQPPKIRIQKKGV